jgi:hypothetical protein
MPQRRRSIDKPRALALLKNSGLFVDDEDDPLHLAALLDKPGLTFVAAWYEADLEEAIEFAGGDYQVVPNILAAFYSEAGDEFVASMEIAFQAVLNRQTRRWQLEQLALRGRSAEAAFDGAHLRELVGPLVEQCTAWSAFRVRQTRTGPKRIPVFEDKQGAQGWFDAYMEEVKPVEPRRGRALGDGHYAQVAEVYRAALDAQKNPTQAVADAFGLDSTHQRRTAARWVEKAREKGMLGPAPGPGRSGERRENDGNR